VRGKKKSTLILDDMVTIEVKPPEFGLNRFIIYTNLCLAHHSVSRDLASTRGIRSLGNLTCVGNLKISETDIPTMNPTLEDAYTFIGCLYCLRDDFPGS